MRCPSKALWLGLALLAFSLPVYSQSFSDEKVYQVTGAQLNRLSQDLQVVRQESEAQTALLKTLREQLDQSKSLLEEAQAQLQIASQSLKKYESQTLETEIAIGAICLVSGGVAGYLWAVGHR